MEEAGSLCIEQRAAEVTVAHLLTAFLDQPASDICITLAAAGLEVGASRQALSTGFADRGGNHSQYPCFSPLLIEVLQEAWLLSSVELGQPHIRSGAIFLATLLNPARYLPLAAIQLFDEVNREALRKRFGELLSGSAEAVGVAPALASSMGTSIHDSALAKYCHNFTDQARGGRIDPVLCRDVEIDLMVDILSRRRKNNPIVVGDAGVGKSAVVEGLALRIVQGRVPESLRLVELWELDLGALQAGASVKGEFEKRLKAVIDEVKESACPIILFIDEAHTLIGAGNAAGGSDAANLLKPALARGELRTIAATTWSEYKKYFEKDPALTRRFQLLKLEEPTPDQAVHVLRGLRPIYEAFHNVFIGDDALQAAAVLTDRYLSGRKLPDKAIDVLDTACSRVASALVESPRRLNALENELNQIDAESAQLARDGRCGRAVNPGRLDSLVTTRHEVEQKIQKVRHAWEQQKALVEKIVELRTRDNGKDASQLLTDKVRQLSELQRTGVLLHADVGAEEIAQVIADWTGIPATTISSDQMARLDSLPANLRNRVKGQDSALHIVYRHLLTALADLRRPGTPMGVFLLVGPSGVGKTETAVAVADALFGGEQFLTTINMSEYQERFTVSRLLGAPPGYVGYGEGGVLTEAIRKQPYPFNPASREEASLEDFTAFFGPDGKLQQFREKYLNLFVEENLEALYFDRLGGYLVRADVLSQLESADRIRDAFFNSRGLLGVQFYVEPLGLAPNQRSSSLGVEGQLITYNHGPSTSTGLIWPNTLAPSNESRVTLINAGGRSSGLLYRGPWSLYRLLSQARLNGATSTSVDISFSVPEGGMRYRISTEKANNPFTQPLFKGFVLPRTLLQDGLRSRADAVLSRDLVHARLQVAGLDAE